MEYYILQNNTKQGPFSIEELKHMNVNAYTMVRSINDSNWKEAKEMPELSGVLSSLPSETPVLDAMPKTWLLESHLVGCTWSLLGLIGMINAFKVEKEYKKGNYQKALQYSNKARKWVVRGLYAGLIKLILFIIIIILAVLARKGII